MEKYELNFIGKELAKKIAESPSAARIKLDKENSRNLKKTKNLFFIGDNLDFLKKIQKAFKEKIKLIYIDPPYNTSSKLSFTDDFSKKEIEILSQSFFDKEKAKKSRQGHNAWLFFMYPRLLLSRNLLKEDGILLVSIDDHEKANLKLILDEIYGEENFVSEFCWINNLQGRQLQLRGPIKIYESILCYAKNKKKIKKFLIAEDYARKKMPEIYKCFNYDVMRDEWGEYVIRGELGNGKLRMNEETCPSLVFNIHYNPSTKEIRFSNAGESVNWEGFDKITPKKNSDGVHRWKAWRWSKNKIIKNSKDLLFEKKENGKYKIWIKSRDVGWTGLKNVIINISNIQSTTELKKFFGKDKIFTYSKPVELLKLFVSLTDKNDIILDFFAGTGTMGQAVIEKNAEDGGNRRFILCQLNEIEQTKKNKNESIAFIAIKRMIMIGDEIIKKNFFVDVGFKVFELVKDEKNENEKKCEAK